MQFKIKMKCLIHRSTNHQSWFNKKEKNYGPSPKMNGKIIQNLPSPPPKKHQTQVVLQSRATEMKEQIFLMLYLCGSSP